HPIPTVVVRSPHEAARASWMVVPEERAPRAPGGGSDESSLPSNGPQGNRRQVGRRTYVDHASERGVVRMSPERNLTRWRRASAPAMAVRTAGSAIARRGGAATVVLTGLLTASSVGRALAAEIENAAAGAEGGAHAGPLDYWSMLFV